MGKVKDVEEKMTALKKQMHKLLHKNDFIITTEIIDISQELDEVIYLYHKIKSIDIKKNQDE
ncbi:Spo0E family sporulation regulatory protein-aspartic acid phosphatase [Senegalia massiliensis]|uniref:Spo0E family sporulation regulatory protein-aspartic acid phosphatase n=1 Tax=Senegalia massiliensis TaxID=1720316 RepID=A0A845R383_9CLOT|nr:Spo0E family sporulation regulatory protein-aspartic acid phosphatase [Senegalia massiliensis]NBI08048.1 Spo0E family sporulation regulatory protein-aspartic acid phosphatase [Senegalia massiliensis]